VIISLPQEAITMLREKSRFLTNIHKALDIAWVVIAYILAYHLKSDWLPFGLAGLIDQPNYPLILVIAILISYFSFSFFSFYEPYRNQSFKRFSRKFSRRSSSARWD
jgi:hypothetical protein